MKNTTLAVLEIESWWANRDPLANDLSELDKIRQKIKNKWGGNPTVDLKAIMNHLDELAWWTGQR
jgi:hypothetical protein